MRHVFGRGLNMSGQLDATYQNYNKFTHLFNFPVRDVGCGYLQTFYFMQDGSLFKFGHHLDTQHNTQLLMFHKYFPYVYKLANFFSTTARKLGLPSLRDKQIHKLNMFEHNKSVTFTRAIFHHSGAFLFDSDNNLYAIGENQFGQRGTGDRVTVSQKMRKIQYLHSDQKALNQKRLETIKKNKKIVDVAIGYHHSILIDQNGKAYGCGRAEYNQIQPQRYGYQSDMISTDIIQIPTLIYSKRRIVKAACGHKHTILLTEDGKLLGLGDNTFGQCGQKINPSKVVYNVTEIFFPALEGQKIIDIKCGSYHTLILTNKHLYFMGSIKMNQNPFARFDQNISSPTIMDLPAKPIKIFCKFQRTAVIGEDGKMYLFGGQEFTRYGGQNNKLEIINQWKLNQNSLVGLGFSHTVVVP